MRAIALETSGRHGSIAVCDDQRLIASDDFPHGLRNTAGVLPMMDAMVRRAGWTPQQLTHCIVSIGPGSFTGLRLAVTIAKTLAFATGCKIVAVPSVRVLAENAPAEAQHVAIVLDAKRGHIFSATFQRQGEAWLELSPARLTTLAEVIETSPKPLWLLGDGLPFLPPSQIEGLHATPLESWRARAEVVAELGRRMAERGELADPMTLTPLYVRRPEPEEKRLGMI